MLDLNRNETVLLSLSQYSTPTNQEWRNASAFIPIDNPMDITVFLIHATFWCNEERNSFC